MFMNLENRRCVVVGGGEVADRKARKLLQARADVIVVSPEVKPGIESVAVETHRREYEPGDLSGAFLAFAATDSREVNAAVAREAKERGVPVNVADAPSDGDFTLPSTLRRGRMQISVSTGGASPTLARDVRKRLEGRFPPEWAGLVEEVGKVRSTGETNSEVEEEVGRCLSRLSG